MSGDPNDYTSPEAVERLLAPPQSYGNGYECCKQQIALAHALKESRELVEGLKANIEQLVIDAHEDDSSFAIRRDADDRAMQRWQKATGRSKVWPDHADLCVWLMGKIENLEDQLGITR